MDKNTLLKIENISKSYKNGDNEQIVLDKVNLQVTKGTSLAIMGSSGSGKTTLLHILALLLNADSGNISITAKILVIGLMKNVLTSVIKK